MDIAPILSEDLKQTIEAEGITGTLFVEGDDHGGEGNHRAEYKGRVEQPVGRGS